MLISEADAEERHGTEERARRATRRGGGGAARAWALRPARRPPHRPDEVATGCGRGGALGMGALVVLLKTVAH